MKPRCAISRVWSVDLAYAVGLLASDGCLLSDGRHIDFTSKDEELVVTLSRCLNLNVRVGRKGRGGSPGTRDYFRVQFGDVVFYDWLVNVGLGPRKSCTLGALAIPDRFFFHFLRGSLDGDGSILLYRDPRWPRSFLVYSMWTSASQAHLSWLAARIADLAGLTGHIVSANGAWQLRYGKKASRYLYSKMYLDPSWPCLIRKRDKLEKALTAGTAGVTSEW